MITQTSSSMERQKTPPEQRITWLILTGSGSPRQVEHFRPDPAGLFARSLRRTQHPGTGMAIEVLIVLLIRRGHGNLVIEPQLCLRTQRAQILHRGAKNGDVRGM